MSALGFPLRVLAIVGGHEAPPPLVAALAQVGRCSATLVGPTVVLTSAHCLDGPIDRVVVAGREVGITGCMRHPAYLVGRVAHDVGYCRLAESVAGALSIDTGSELYPGQTVSLAGFGASATTARDKPALRVVSTSLVASSGDHLEVGTATATACRGDSGGPVLVERAGAFGVAGIIEGTQGVLCGSPARAVPLRSQMDWLTGVLVPGRPPGHGLLVLALVLIAGACAAAVRMRRKEAK